MSSSRRRPERRLSIAQGRDAREIQLPPSAGKCFLLTSPFIERMRHIILRSPRLQGTTSARSGTPRLAQTPAVERLRFRVATGPYRHYSRLLANLAGMEWHCSQARIARIRFRLSADPATETEQTRQECRLGRSRSSTDHTCSRFTLLIGLR